MASRSTNSVPVLVTGGCGFLGFHLIKCLLQDPVYSPIVSVNRNPTVNLQDGVIYRAGSVTDRNFITSLLQEFKPRVIFHTASPRFNDPVKTREFVDTNVKGTSILLECAAESGSVEAFIYSSTVNVISGCPHVGVDENGPMWTEKSKTIPYWKSKAEADRLVLKSNSSGLKTVSLRLCLILGERDNAMVPAQLDTYNKKQTGVQLGDNKNLFDTVSAENAATAHMLAAKALLNPQEAGKVAGEAFNITDGNPVPIWDLARMVWRAAGDTTELKDVQIIPGWAAMAMASAAEWAFRVFTLGQKRPEMNTLVVNFCIREYTYNIDKARRVLGYQPVAQLEDLIKRSVEWELRKRETEGKNGIKSG